MPTILRIEGFRFFFYSNEHKPEHIHVEKADNTAKFTIDPVELIKSKGFSSKEINHLRKLIIVNKEHLIHSWNEYFNN